MLIIVENLLKAYEGRDDLALSGVSFEVDEGECFGLLGPNGAGKTTILGCLLGLLNPDSGKVSIAGLEPTDLSIREVIGFLPERPNFEGWFTAREYLKYHHALSKQKRKNRNKDVEATLEKVGLIKDAWDRPIKKFSRGMLQRIGLAQALIGNPKILFLDEPGSGMDPPGITLLREILLELKERKTTIVLNSHHLDEMEKVCDRVAFINRGRIKSIKTLSKEVDNPYVLVLHWLENDDSDKNIKEDIDKVVAISGSTLLEIKHNMARVQVIDSKQAAQVIRLSIQNYIPLLSASPESTTLEGMFTDTDSKPRKVDNKKTDEEVAS